MTDQEKAAAKRRASFYTNMAYLLADVADTCITNVESSLKVIEQEVQYGEKKKFKRLRQEASKLRELTKATAEPIYKIPQVDDAVEDSDWLFNFIATLITRVGDNPEKMLQARAAIFNMKPEFEI